ncbi:hypothetical protein HK405_006309 [Cladochytrium tenue]|nr:hypothetical protein HK405_006309 [Cladochytrium tenue]
MSDSTSLRPVTAEAVLSSSADHYGARAAPPAALLHRLVHEYLLHACCPESARALRTACPALLTTTTADAEADSAEERAKVSVTMTAVAEAAAAMDVDDDEDGGGGGGAGGGSDGDEDGDADGNGRGRGRGRDGGSEPRLGGLVTAADGADGRPIAAAAGGGRWAAYERTIAARQRLVALVTAGRVREALAECEGEFPGLLNGDGPDAVDVCFQLKCQQFVECVRTSAAEALQFAQNELSRFGPLNPKYYQTLEDVVALLAYTDPSSSPVSGYLSQEHRDEVAHSLNSFILKRECLPVESPLERIIRQATVVRDNLNDLSIKDKKGVWKTAFPKWTLSGFIDRPPAE